MAWAQFKLQPHSKNTAEEKQQRQKTASSYVSLKPATTKSSVTELGATATLDLFMNRHWKPSRAKLIPNGILLTDNDQKLVVR